jgi:hypothetical protein
MALVHFLARPHLRRRFSSAPALLAILPLLIVVAAHAQTPTATTTTLAVTSGGSTVTTVSWGNKVTLTATVQAGTALVTPGQVEFCDASAAHCEDIHIVGMAQLTSTGTAVINIRPAPGSHSYKAVFIGTNRYAASTSTTTALSVTGKFPSETTISQSGSAGDYTFSSTVSGAGPVAPTGTVSFLDTSTGDSLLATAPLGSQSAGLSFLNSATPATGANPDSIATADFNGDGIPDTVVSNDIGLSLTVLLGNGDGTFTPAASPEFCSNPGSIAVGDFNNDGIPDLAIVAFCNSLTVLLGKGDGTFTAKTTNIAGIAASTFVVGDFNGDGNLDLAGVGTNDDLTVLLGKGDGTFTAESLGSATTGFVESMAVGDFNGDGIPDLAVTNPTENTVSIFLGNGDGTFTLESKPPTGDFPAGIAAGDFKGDGVVDLAVTNFRSNTVTVLLGDGTGKFTPTASPLVTGSNPSSIAVGDFNGDGIPDLAVANYGSDTITVFLGDGTGNFSASATSPATDEGPIAIAAADFNGDGLPDLATANYSANSATVVLGAIETSTATTTVRADIGADQMVASYPGDSTYSGIVSSKTGTAAALTSPTPGSTLAGSSVTFAWTAGVGITSYELRVGTTGAGSNNIFDSGPTTANSAMVSNIPLTDEMVYVELVSVFAAAPMQTASYTFTGGTPTPATLTAPTGTTLAGSSVAFAWSTGVGVSRYQLRLGTTGPGSENIYDSDSTPATSATVNNIPTNGGTVYVALSSEINGVWQFTGYTFLESGGPPTPAALTAPTATKLTGFSQTFTWSPGSGVSAYELWVGTTGFSSSNISDSGWITATSATVNNIPTNGGTVFVRLYSLINGAWQFTDYTFNESGGPPTPAALTSPTGTTLAGSPQTFTWSAGVGVTRYQLHVGTTGPGAKNIYDSDSTTAMSATVSNIPASGETVYVALSSEIDGVWHYVAYTFTAP